MKKFSTALLFSAGLAPGLPAQAQPEAALPEFRQAPQPRAVSKFARLPVVDQWPRAIVLDGRGEAMAQVLGGAGSAGGRLFVAGDRLRLATPITGAGRRPVYRPGPWITPDGAADAARLALRIGSVEAAQADGAQVRVVRGQRELAAGDLVPVEASPQHAAQLAPVPAVAARVARQHGSERVRWLGERQLLALDSGAAHGVRAGMCVHAGGCDNHSGASGRILHAAMQASVALLPGNVVAPDVGEDVCIAPCPDDPA